MKQKLLAILMIGLLGVVVENIFAQQAVEEVVYLKNGGIIRGTIIEQVPGKSIKIQTREGNVFVYSMDEVERITKEAPITPQTQPAKDVYATDKSHLGVNPLGFVVGGLSWLVFERSIGSGITYQARLDIIRYEYEERDGSYSYDEDGSGFGGGFSLRAYTLGTAPYSGLFGAFGLDVAYTKWD